MGAFLLKHKSHNTPNLAIDYFSERGFSNPDHFQLKDWSLELFKKTLIKNSNYYFISKNAIFCTGTVVYKNNFYEDSLKSILQDQINNNLDFTKIHGTFVIIFFINNKISILRDQSNISNVYYNIDKTVISSSFLATSDYHQGKLTLNKDTITENLCTGFIIGPDTIFNEIKRLENSYHNDLSDIHILKPKINLDKKSPESFEEAVNNQIDYLNSYFKSTKKIADKYGVDSGLTGGFDSRLLLILGLKNYNNIDFHSFYKKQKSTELECAKEVSLKAGKKLKIVPVTTPLDMDQDKLLETISSSFIYCDGNVRMHSYWHEEYNTLNHRKEILENKRLGLHGIGGEQYRNEERVFLNKRNFLNWVKYDLVFKYSGNCFKTSTYEKVFLQNYVKKISDILNIKSSKIDKYHIKKYFTCIQTPGLRGLRTNIENADIFFLSPFADYIISENAFNAIPFLGLSAEFQQVIIKHLNPNIASVQSDYGFDFYKGESFLMRMFTIIKELIPKRIYYKYYIQRKSSHNDKSYWNYIGKFPVLKEFEKEIIKLDLPLNLDILKSKSDLFPLIWSMGFLISRFKQKLNN